MTKIEEDPRLNVWWVIGARVMARRRVQLRRPGDYVDGPFLSGRLDPAAPVGVAHVRHIAVEVRRAFDQLELTVVDAANGSGLHRATIHGLLAGDAYPDVLTVAQLEEVLERDLWPRR